MFVIAVDDGGPAAKAGIEEGSRIASINGVDVRGKRSEDDEIHDLPLVSNISRFEREVNKLKPGDDATLRVYYNGQVPQRHGEGGARRRPAAPQPRR